MSEGKEKSGSVSSFLKGIVAGAASAAVYLFMRDKENRKKVEWWMNDARADILEKLAQMEEVSKDRYHKTVDEVLAKYHTSHDVAEETLEEFSNTLKGRWGRIKKEAQGGFEDAKSHVQKAAKELREEARRTNNDNDDAEDTDVVSDFEGVAPDEANDELR